MEVHWPLLSVLIWLPILGGLLTLAFGDARAAQGKWFALLVALATFVLSLLLFPGHDTSSAAMRFVEDVPWVPSFDIRWHVGVDGISIALIALTTLTTALVLVGASTCASGSHVCTGNIGTFTANAARNAKKIHACSVAESGSA